MCYWPPDEVVKPCASSLTFFLSLLTCILRGFVVRAVRYFVRTPYDRTSCLWCVLCSLYVQEVLFDFFMPLDKRAWMGFFVA